VILSGLSVRTSFPARQTSSGAADRPTPIEAGSTANDGAAYERRHRERVAAAAASEEAAAELIQCVPPEYQWRGLDRYWRKREEREAA